MKSNPWYSTARPEEEGTVAVHHDNALCKIGSLIGRNFRRYGTDNRPLCKRCEALDAEGK